ncbi:Protein DETOXIFICATION [Seminavis robusta]|uniref:Protein DETOXIFICATION n=1 Tax=Seminavis robusta TaxID=568900 RepID=A0A9N8ET65_9STRA|nr:Protein DETOXIFICATION [Seminavis robusta]|eukprot:Sro1515_g279010.1 Protein DETOXIFICATION (561) ;mRNA; f:9296-11158
METPHSTQPSSGSTYINKLLEEAKDQFKTSWPTLCALVLYRFPWLISLAFVGAIGSDELAAAALATTLCNVTGMSLSVGLSSALTTLTGQARGDLLERHKRQNQPTDPSQTPLLKASNSPNASTQHRYESCRVPSGDDEDFTSASPRNDFLLPMVFLYRGLFVQLLLVVPVGMWWLSGIHDVLESLGQNETIATMTASYLKVLAPGLWAYSINWTITSWLQAIEMADVPAYAAGAGLALHIPFNYFFIYVLRWGYLGVAVATTTSQLIQPLGTLIYLFGFSVGRSRVLQHTVASAVGRNCISSGFRVDIKMGITSYAGMKTYLGLAIPGIITISEWWASEIAIFLAGRLHPNPAVALGGMTLYQSINSFCFMFPLASSIAGSARVGKFLGANEPERAGIAAKVSVYSAMLVSGIIGCILYIVPHEFFPSLFTHDGPVVAETSRTIPLLATYVFADGLQVALNGIIKGCGRQCVTMPIVITAYWVFGVPVSYYLAFRVCGGEMSDDMFCGVVGLVSGLTLGTWLHMGMLAMVVIATTNWQAEAFKAKQRLVHADESRMDLT